jgi:hypothetical protein
MKKKKTTSTNEQPLLMTRLVTELLEKRHTEVDTDQIIMGVETHRGKMLSNLVYVKGNPVTRLGMIEMLLTLLEKERAETHAMIQEELAGSQAAQSAAEEDTEHGGQDVCSCQRCQISRAYGHDEQVRTLLEKIDTEILQDGEPSESMLTTLAKRIVKVSAQMGRPVVPMRVNRTEEEHPPLTVNKPVME